MNSIKAWFYNAYVYPVRVKYVYYGINYFSVYQYFVINFIRSNMAPHYVSYPKVIYSKTRKRRCLFLTFAKSNNVFTNNYFMSMKHLKFYPLLVQILI